jgi:hypothetical protein
MARNTYPRTRALIAGVLFVSWIGYLAYLVSITRDTIPLARPQIETADLVVVADVMDDGGRALEKVRIKETLSGRHPPNPELVIEDLPFCGSRQGYRGAGSYVIPLERSKGSPNFRVKLLPVVPGYFPPTMECEICYVDDKVAVAKALALQTALEQRTGLSANRIEAMFVTPCLTVPNLFMDETEPPRRETKPFEDRIRKAGGTVGIPIALGETRIYLATPRVLDEVRQLLH